MRDLSYVSADTPEVEAGSFNGDGRFRLAGPNGVEVVPGRRVELPEFQLDYRRADGGSPREVLRRFDPDRAGLPATSFEQATTHLAQHKDGRPWLRSAERYGPEVQRVIAAIDRGQGHALQRHEGQVTPQELRDRVTRLRDPAQLDPQRYERAQDAHRSGIHRCGASATQIWDAAAFATAFARGIEHPKVRARLEQEYDPFDDPEKLGVPIAELLGPDGHEFCHGYHLDPAEGSLATARSDRKVWVHAERNDQEPEVPEPRCSPIDSFKGGTIEFSFRPTPDRTSYEIGTMHPEPPLTTRENT